MNNTHTKCWTIIKCAREKFMHWSSASGFPVHRIEYVATFEPWDDSIEIYVFFFDDALLESATQKSFIEHAKTEYMTILKKEGYPFEQFPKVSFQFDSHENVQRNYEGSYFYRLR